jgi:predicted amidohydrolase YtcJ
VRAAIDALRAFGRVTGDGDAHHRVGALEVYVDGGFTGPSAATLVPYRDQPTYSGALLLTDDALRALATAAHAMRWQMALHTVGDAAIAQAVRVLSRVARESPRADPRHYLDHFSVLPPDSVLTAMVTARLAVAQQPAFTYTLERRYREYLDSARLATNTPLRSLARRRIPLAFGSDNLPVSPLLGLATAVTRAGRSGAVYAPGEALTVREAITAYTRTGAWLTREERLKGTIQPGKLADLIVLSDDPLLAPPAEIARIRVLMAILGGRVAYQREGIR